MKILYARVVAGDDLDDTVCRHSYAVLCSGNLKGMNHRCLNKHLHPGQYPRSKDDKDGKESKQEMSSEFLAGSRFTEKSDCCSFTHPASPG